MCMQGDEETAEKSDRLQPTPGGPEANDNVTRAEAAAQMLEDWLKEQPDASLRPDLLPPRR